MKDEVRPDHYKRRKYEVIRVIEDTIKAQNLPGYEAYLVGQVLKYITRYRLKGAPTVDLDKAAQYLEWLKREVAKDD